MNPDDGISPWRNAKPRKPLTDYNRSPGGKSPNFGKSPLSQSPPNSGFKESTRMETSLDSPANSSMKLDLSGASPSLFRGEEAKSNQVNKSGKANSSKTAQTSYTKLRSSVTPLQKKARARKKVEDGSESESSSEVEDDQPSGKCQYVGDTSNMSSTTINNTSMASTASVRRKGNNSVRQMSQSVTSPASTSTAPLSPPPVSKTSSVCSCLFWVVVAGVAIMVYAVMLEGQGSNKLLSSTSQDTREHWLGARNMFRSELRSLVTQFPNQSSTTWKMISATLKSPMASSPEYPGVLLLLSTPSSQDTATCLASRLAHLASRAFSQPGLQHPPASQQQLVISSLSLPSVDPHQAKEELTTLLHSSLSTWGVSVITSLHHLHPVPALTLHAFADNSNAPYKQAVIILSLSHSVEDEEVATSLEKRAEMLLAREWSKELGEDKLYALISRLVVSVAEVQRENRELLSNCW